MLKNMVNNWMANNRLSARHGVIRNLFIAVNVQRKTIHYNLNSLLSHWPKTISCASFDSNCAFQLLYCHSFLARWIVYRDLIMSNMCVQLVIFYGRYADDIRHLTSVYIYDKHSFHVLNKFPPHPSPERASQSNYNNWLRNPKMIFFFSENWEKKKKSPREVGKGIFHKWRKFMFIYLLRSKTSIVTLQLNKVSLFLTLDIPSSSDVHECNNIRLLGKWICTSRKNILINATFQQEHEHAVYINNVFEFKSVISLVNVSELVLLE